MLLGTRFTCGHFRKCCLSVIYNLISMNIIIDSNKYILDISGAQRIKNLDCNELDVHQRFSLGV